MRETSGGSDGRRVDNALAVRAGSRAWFHRYPRGWPFLLFALTALGTAACVIAIEHADHQKDSLELDRNATEIASGLQRRVSENVALLRAGAALFASSDTVTAGQFDEFTDGLYGAGESHGARGTAWARLIAARDVPALESDMRAHGSPTYAVHPSPSPGNRIAVPVVFIAPASADNVSALGYDMYSEPVRRAAMDKALRMRQPVASGRLTLLMDIGKPNVAGFIIYMPVLRRVGGRRVALGFVYSTFRAPEFLDAAASLYQNRQVEVAIYDQVRDPSRLLALRAAPGVPGVSLDRVITIAGREWILHVSSNRSRTLTTLSRVTLFFGVILGLLVMYTARLITKRAAEDREVVEWLTRQVSIRNSLTLELNHRVKNTLANVLSIVALTRRRSRDLDEFSQSLTARLRALSATHDLLSRSDWTDALIGDIVHSELAPYIEGGERHVAIDGPEIRLAPNDALSLGLAIHELATNAAKYGALSAPEGRIAVEWRRLSPALAEVHWRESGGPAVTAPSTRGFGRELIEKIVAHELRSKVELQFHPEGVECRLKVPVRRQQEFSLRGSREERHPEPALTT